MGKKATYSLCCLWSRCVQDHTSTAALVEGAFGGLLPMSYSQQGYHQHWVLVVVAWPSQWRPPTSPGTSLLLGRRVPCIQPKHLGLPGISLPVAAGVSHSQLQGLSHHAHEEGRATRTSGQRREAQQGCGCVCS